MELNFTQSLGSEYVNIGVIFMVCCMCGTMAHDDSGINLMNSHICAECELKIIDSNDLDDRYCFYLEHLKEVWCIFLAETDYA